MRYWTNLTRTIGKSTWFTFTRSLRWRSRSPGEKPRTRRIPDQVGLIVVTAPEGQLCPVERCRLCTTSIARLKRWSRPNNFGHTDLGGKDLDQARWLRQRGRRPQRRQAWSPMCSKAPGPRCGVGKRRPSRATSAFSRTRKRFAGDCASHKRCASSEACQAIASPDPCRVGEMSAGRPERKAPPAQVNSHHRRCSSVSMTERADVMHRRRWRRGTAWAAIRSAAS